MSASATVEITKMPSELELEKMREQDSGYTEAKADPVGYMQGRQKAVYKISRKYHLDGEELFQEGYEVLLTCLRDFNPVFQRSTGEFVTVQFTTFFGNRMDSRAMEMRNKNPEYQARQAYTESLSDSERKRFKEDPPLLVQHLDHESAAQEHLRGEASAARGQGADDVNVKIARDSYFEQTLDKLVAKEKDEKKKAALLHVKVGGVYNFQEIAYHFGVTDSRASQVMNELMDAFYVQRAIDGCLESIQRDFARLRFNEKRAVRLLAEAYTEATDERRALIVGTFSNDYPSLSDVVTTVPAKKAVADTAASKATKEVKAPKALPQQKAKAPAYRDVFTDEENKKYPLVGVELRPIDKLYALEDFDFHRPESEEEFYQYTETHEFDDGQWPAIINQNGFVIDGQRRIDMARDAGRKDYMCIVRQVDDEDVCKHLRAAVNLRQIKPTKLDLYHAICALSDLGLAQQKISTLVGTSRTNVLVYLKVRDKASPKMRALFEDGLVQVTNASSCSEMSDDVQDKIAQFIRRAGVAWSKGAKFNNLFGAAADGKIDAFISENASEMVVPDDLAGAVTSAPANRDESAPSAKAAVSSKAAQMLQSRIDTLESALKDSEVWNQRREGVINQQREALEQSSEEIEQLKKELEANELMQFGSPKAIEEELKALKQFYLVSERLSGSVHALGYAAKDVRKLTLRRNQANELQTLIDDIESALNTVRIELVNAQK